MVGQVLPAGLLDPSLSSLVLGNLTEADQQDFVQRIAGLLPPSWFGAGATEVDAVTAQPGAPILTLPLSGASYNMAWAYSLYSYVLKQSRIATASGVWLDRISFDFFGNKLPRFANESDTIYRIRIYQELFRERATREGIIQALVDLTGFSPNLMELWNPQDCGGYDAAQQTGWDVAGGYGDLTFRNQILVTAFRSVGSGVPGVDGYDNPAAGYDTGAIEYIDMDWITGLITDNDIFSAVQRVVAAGCTAWVAILNAHNINGNEPQMYFGDVENTVFTSLVSFF